MRIKCLLVAMSLLGSFNAALLRAAEEPVKATEAKPLTIAQIPATAQKTVLNMVGTGKIDSIAKDEDDGEVYYTIDFTKDGRDREMTVLDSGVLYSIDVTIEETPAEAQKAIKKIVDQSTLDNIDRVFEDGLVSYEVDITTKAGKERTFTVSADGKLLSMQVGIEETPDVVRKTIEEHIGKATLGDIYRNYETNRITYDVVFTRNGIDRDFTVGEGGKILYTQVFLPELPPPAKKTVNEQVVDGKILRIDKAFGAGTTFHFEIEAKKDGKPLNFRVGVKGRLLGVDD